MTAVTNAINSIFRTDDENAPLNILVLCRNNEKYIELLCHTKHNFYILQNHPWNGFIAKRPENLKDLNPHTPPLDLIICHDRTEQYMEACGLAFNLHVPLVLIDQCSQELMRPHSVIENLQARNIDELINRRPNFSVASSKFIGSSWGYTESTAQIVPLATVERYYADVAESTETYVSMDNNISTETGSVISNIINGQYQLIPTDHENLDDIAVAKSKYFINTYCNVTIKLLEAMAAKNVVICLRNKDTMELITDRKNGILIDNLHQIPSVIRELEHNPILYNSIVDKAKNDMVKNHTLEAFVNGWHNVFSTVRSAFYLPHLEQTRRIQTQ